MFKRIGVCFSIIFSIFSISAFAANNCTGATYYDADSDTCIACPTGYDYNTDAGKTSASQCQISCPAGTWNGGYTQLEYLESTGTQYIDTEYIPTAITRTEIDLKFTGDTYASSGGASFFGTTRYTANFGGNSNQGYKIYPWLCSYGTSSCAVALFDINASLKTTRQTFVFDAQNKIASYGTVSKSLSGQTQPSVPDGSIHLFGYLNSNTNTVGVYSRNAGMYIYETRIYEDGVLVRKFVPARRNSDNEIGLYDTVTKQFFTNAGSGTFIAGSDVGNINGAQCVDVGVGYYAGASTVNYGSVGTRTACPAGTYSSITNAASCTSCTGATYNDETAQSSCKACPTGYDYNTTAGKTDITECQIHCDAGTYVSVYTQLEYIESDGSQYIDTGYIPSNLTGIKTKVQFLSVANGKMTVCSAAQALHNKAFELYGWNRRIQFHFNNGEVNGATISVNDVVEVDWNKNIMDYSINGIAQSRLTGLSGTFTSPYTMNLFATHRSASSSGSSMIKMYYFQIYDNDVLVHNFVPARRNSDNEIGMYDTVTRQFFTNSGTGSFTAGPDASLCVDVGVGYYAGASTTNYGSIGTRTACPAGTFTVGYGHGADEANDCGRILHLGDSVIYTRRNKPTTPALNIRMENGDMYYIGLSTTDHTVSRLHFQTGDTKYTAFDDSLFYGERDYDTGEKITQ